MTNEIVIVDYGVGNIANVERALKRAGADVSVSGESSVIAEAAALLLPGVGAFQAAIEKLRQQGLDAAIKHCAAVRKRPVLGICLGMQLLFEESDEGGRHEGLGLAEGKISKMPLDGARDFMGRPLRLPHIGWNDITPSANSRLFAGVETGEDFYFVHSHALYGVADEEVAAHCEYGAAFACAFEKGNIFAAQFHPEKSQVSGHKVLKNFVTIAAEFG